MTLPVVIILHYINVSNQHVVHLNFTRLCFIKKKNLKGTCYVLEGGVLMLGGARAPKFSRGGTRSLSMFLPIHLLHVEWTKTLSSAWRCAESGGNTQEEYPGGGSVSESRVRQETQSSPTPQRRVRPWESMWSKKLALPSPYEASTAYQHSLGSGDSVIPWGGFSQRQTPSQELGCKDLLKRSLHPMGSPAAWIESQSLFCLNFCTHLSWQVRRWEASRHFWLTSGRATPEPRTALKATGWALMKGQGGGDEPTELGERPGWASASPCPSSRYHLSGCDFRRVPSLL